MAVVNVLQAFSLHKVPTTEHWEGVHLVVSVILVQSSVHEVPQAQVASLRQSTGLVRDAQVLSAQVVPQAHWANLSQSALA